MMLSKLLDQRYQVVKVLGEGGFGHTYIAQDTRRPGNPTCVVKHLKPATSDPEFLQTARRLFNSEAETLEKLGDHDQIPRLLAYFEEDEEFYLVEEFIDGHPLSVELPPGQRWTESQVIQLLQEILSILEFVHNNGVIHRDLKPDNLIRRACDHKIVLVDFGAVKQVQMHSLFTQQAVNETVAIGTPGYMPSEQGQGRPRPSSDIYALGMIGIQALTGLNPRQLLEEPETGEIIWRTHVQVSDTTANILNQMVRHYFKNRYQSATEALQAIASSTNFSKPAVLAAMVSQKVSGFFRSSYWSVVRSLREAQYRSATMLLRTIDPSATPTPLNRTSDPGDPGASTIPIPQPDASGKTISVAPANPWRSPTSPQYNHNPAPQSASKLPLLIGGGSVILAIGITVINRQQPPTAVVTQNKTAATPSKPKPEPKKTCFVVTSPTNLRTGSGRSRTGKVIPEGTKLAATGKEEAGWMEINSPESGWVWKSRTKNICPTKK